MIDRVALAIYCDCFGNNRSLVEPHWESRKDNTKDEFTAYARAAIGEMLEPSDEMVNSYLEKGWQFHKVAYRDMINSILEEYS